MLDDPLLRPFDMGKGLILRNRVVSTPHEPGYTENGLPKDRYRLYHVEKARGGVGLTMIGGSACVSLDSPAAFGNIAMHDDVVIPWLKRLADDVHAEGAAVMIQLTHLGRRTADTNSEWLPTVSASEVREPAHRSFPKPAETFDLARIRHDFVAAALRAQEAGLDGIELLHYGHFLDSFVSPWLNHRDDEYSRDARQSFVIDVIEDIVAAVKPDFHVGIRMAIDERRPDGIDPDMGLRLLDDYVAAGISFVSVISGTIESDKTLADVIPGMGKKSSPFIELSGRVKQSVDIPVMHAAGISDVSSARHCVESGLMDLVGMTRAFIADPHLMKKVGEGREDDIRPCVGANYCLDSIYSAAGTVCIHNHATGREGTIPHETGSAPAELRIVVVGAGPAGLEAARVGGMRGHRVTVFEAAGKYGGQIRLATRNRMRTDLIGIADWRYGQALKHNVDFRFNTLVDPEDISAMGADVVIVATGGSDEVATVYESVPGIEHALDSWGELERTPRKLGRVLVFDDEGRYAPLDTALHLAAGGNHVELVTPERTFGVDVGAMNIPPYIEAFDYAGIPVTLNRRLHSIEKQPDGSLRIALSSEYSERVEHREVDEIVVCHGTRPNTDVYDGLLPLSANRGEVDLEAFIRAAPQVETSAEPVAESGPRVYRIGDAVSSRNIHAAIFDAFRLVNGL